MIFEDACNFRMPFGQYKGQRLDSVGCDDDGLLYLSGLDQHEFLTVAVRFALDAYLSDSAIKADLYRALSRAG